MSPPAALPRSFVRQEQARLVAHLSRRVGVAHLAAVEDAVQTAFERALTSWDTPPDAPSAWLYRVAHRVLLDELRKSDRRRRLLSARPEDEASSDVDPPRFGREVEDDQLRMVFACCDERIPGDSRLVLALSICGGFETREIARRLFRTEADVYKRLSRARERLRAHPDLLDDLHGEELRSRLSSVQASLYLLFAEGHLASHAELALRRELCDEALRLTAGLAAHPVTSEPSSFALLALMYLHRSRMASRVRGATLVLLEEQDRSAWDRADIETGLSWLARSAEGEVYTRYHAEAAIAAEHALAPSLGATRWARIAEAYARLERLSPSPLHRLNRALAWAEVEGPEAGLKLLEGFVPPTWLEGSYLWSAALSDLYRRAGQVERSAHHREVALELAPSAAVAEALARRLG